MRTGVVLICAVAVSLSWTRLSLAGGCSYGCDVAVTPATVEPELSCATVSADAEQDCVCNMIIRLENGCDFLLETTSGAFDYCTIDGDIDHECEATSVEPGEFGGFVRDLGEVGKFELVREIMAEGQVHTLRTTAEVTRFNNDGSGCMCSPSPANMNSTVSSSAVFVVALLRRRARKLR